MGGGVHVSATDYRMDGVVETFSGPTQLLARALEGVRAERALLALPPEPGLPQRFSASLPGAHVLYHDYAVYRCDKESAAGRDDAHLWFAPRCPPAAEPHDMAVVYLPKSKDEIAFCFSVVSEALAPAARVMIVGPKKSAIRSSRPVVEHYIGPVGASRPGRHCVLVEAHKAVTANTFEGVKTHRVEALGHPLDVVSLPGVFSHGKLDEGTGFLLEHLDVAGCTSALDWGCGAGVIGAALTVACPEATVDLVDSHVLAIESARRTLEANGLPADRVFPSDVFSDVHGTYDLIVSNPPFHQGLRADFSVPRRFIAEAAAHLTRRGRLVIVASSFINYTRHLAQAFGKVRVLAESKLFRVIEVRRTTRR